MTSQHKVRVRNGQRKQSQQAPVPELGLGGNGRFNVVVARGRIGGMNSSGRVTCAGRTQSEVTA